MRTAFEEDEDEITRHTDDDREVTLSSTTVLLIFFGLVLVCGLCFGLGYTLGHRSTPEGAISAPVVTQAPLVASTSGQPKPSAAASVTPAPVTDTPASGADASSDAPAGNESSAAKTPVHEAAHEAAVHEATAPAPAIKATAQVAPPQAAAQTRPALVQTAQAVQPQVHPATQATTPAATVAPATPTPAGIMVQVAAISNPNDAQVLVGALRKHGFSASVHTQSSDSLLRVQVGPFATRAEAAAMKQKLLAEGYNAILK